MFIYTIITITVFVYIYIVEQLILKWAPLIWLSPDEKYMPSSIEQFLRNVHLKNDKGHIVHTSLYRKFPKIQSKSLYLVPRKPIDFLKHENGSFLFGQNPKEYSVPVYAVTTHCPTMKSYYNPIIGDQIRNDISTNVGIFNQHLFFHVAYWIFYPYNEGKEVCFIGKVPTPLIFNRCFGKMKTMGNHVGDWEHVSLSFAGKPYPSHLYLSVHDAGVYYKYDPMRRIFQYESKVIRKGVVQPPKYPQIVRMQGGHPVLFAARGSHGLWSAPGEHEFVRVPRFTDKSDFGTPWKTWNNVSFHHVGIDPIPDWMSFEGKWGNAKANCLLFQKLGLCEYTEGPSGVIRNKQDFYCRQLI